MTIPFQTVKDAFDFVNFGSPYEHEAYIGRLSGQPYYYSEFGDNEEELPQDIDDEDKYIAIPHKNDLDVGRNLVFEFVDSFLPDEYEEVQRIFQRKGAYSRFKNLLEQHQKLEQWYAFEEERLEKALRQWCEDNDLKVSG